MREVWVLQARERQEGAADAQGVPLSKEAALKALSRRTTAEEVSVIAAMSGADFSYAQPTSLDASAGFGLTAAVPKVITSLYWMQVRVRAGEGTKRAGNAEATEQAEAGLPARAGDGPEADLRDMLTARDELMNRCYIRTLATRPLGSYSLYGRASSCCGHARAPVIHLACACHDSAGQLVVRMCRRGGRPPCNQY